MALPYKFNFRGSAAFATDGAGETYVIDSTGASAGIQGEQYPVSPPRDSITFGWDNNTTATRDRNITPPTVQFAGLHRNEAANLATFRVDLPATGSYVIKLAAGDYIQGCGTVIAIYDDAVSLFSISGSTSGADKFKDSAGTETSSAAWNDPGQTVTFSSTTNGSGGPIFYMKIGDGAGLNTGNIAHLEIAAAAGGGGSTRKSLTLLGVS